ncbi:hypothetical protein, partial [Kitasatospora sp. NPDC097643]|uniref:hypothetical protein n=1 Tax=Kitasatospora sp. NPDC097643 TaxID=3157230 RepID=UPI003318E293
MHVRAQGHRNSHGEIVAEWQQLWLVDGRVCVSFTGTPGVWACQDVYRFGTLPVTCTAVECWSATAGRWV